jgi:hypothetical protein
MQMVQNDCAAPAWSIPSLINALEAAPRRYFATLTSRRPMASHELSTEVRRCLHQVQAQMLGPSYRRRGYRFSCYVVQEENFREGLHAHLLAGYDPRHLKRFSPPPFEEALIRTWGRLGSGRSPTAQHVQEIPPGESVRRVIGYLSKTVRNAQDVDRIDLLNCHIS